MIESDSAEIQANPERDWPSMSQEAASSTFAVELEKDGNHLRIVRRLACGETTVARTVAWSSSLADVRARDDAYDALSAPDFDLTLCSVAALGSGHECATRRIAAVLTHHSERRREAEEREAAARLEAEEKARREAEEAARESELAVYFRKKDGEYRLVIKRNHHEAPELWSIGFGETWERERFWDWFKWQGSRWKEIAVADPAVPKVALERSLIEAMLKDEQAVKKQGLGAGGRRPLRFWRGAE